MGIGRWVGPWGVVALLLLPAAPAVARPIVTEPCFNDTDCGGPECGGWVCDWNQISPFAMGDKMYTCVPPGISPKGNDGWCTTDDNCKCRSLGAKCAGVRCSFTRPEDAPNGGGAASSGGTPSAGAPAAGGLVSSGGAPSRGGSAPAPEPAEPADGDDMGQADTGAPRTVEACSVSNVGRGSGAGYFSLFGVITALLGLRWRKRARIPH